MILSVGGGYGTTGVSISNTGNIQANGTLTIDGISTLTGDVTTSNDVAVNGGDITTTAGTASLFNTTATILSIGGDATTVSIGDATGTTTVNNDLSVTGDFTANSALTALGQSTFTPGVGEDVVITTDYTNGTYLNVTGLPTASGDILCLDGSSNVSICNDASISLQAAYVAGNTITTTSARDIAFTLSTAGTDANFTITTADDAIGSTQFLRASGVGTNSPTQLVLIDNQDDDIALPAGLVISSTGGGGITTALDVSDSTIVTAIALGANNITGSGFSVNGGTGDITSTGDLALQGGDITTTNTSASVFNTGATTVAAFGAATTLTLGANNSGTANIRNATVNFSSASIFTANSAAASFLSNAIGGGYGSTGCNNIIWGKYPSKWHTYN